MLRQDGVFFREEDLIAIESVLYTPKDEELVARKFISVNTAFAPFAVEIGYDWYERTGSAKILSAGAGAKDIPFVGEKGGRETMKVYTIATGIRYTKEERMAAQAKSALGKGASISLDTLRVETARRYVAEVENKIAFVGSKSHGIKGILNHSGVTAETVANGTGGKTTWADKTPIEKLKDLLKAKKTVEKGNLFKARVLLLDSDSYNSLLLPYSDSSPMTVLSWIQSQGAYFEKIISTSALNADNNGLSANAFCVMDNAREIVELAVVEDLTLGNPVYDIIGTSEQGVTERCAGCIIRHPAAIYVGKGI